MNYKMTILALLKNMKTKKSFMQQYLRYSPRPVPIGWDRINLFSKPGPRELFPNDFILITSHFVSKLVIFIKIQ